MKRVRIALEMDLHFVSMLRATVGLKGLGPDLNRQHTALEVLGVIVLAEARGALPEQVHLLCPPEWRPHIEAVTDARHVTILREGRGEGETP